MKHQASPVKGQWYRLPSDRIVQIFNTCIDMDETTTPATLHLAAVVRHINDDGAMQSGEFNLSFSFLLNHATLIDVCP